MSSTSKKVIWLLLGYLCAHPEAKDTAEGIAHWWLRVRGVDVHDRDVMEALTALVLRGWLLQSGSTVGNQIYSVNPDRRAEWQQLCGGCP